jgi:hypothetical protein
MPRKISAVEQRREQINAQVERLRHRLASRTRKDYSTDFHYERWVARSNALIDELLAELSVLEEPGEYDQLPPAVVAEELGTTTAKVRQLIKSGEILASGSTAHEYISREELVAACETGVKRLLQHLSQGSEEIFEESVVYLHQGHLQLAERACKRLIARETIIGLFALPYETGLLLARAELDEVVARLRFIAKSEYHERAHFVRNIRRILRGMSYKNQAARAIAERFLCGDDELKVETRKVLGTKLDEQQQLAMFIATVVFSEVDRRWKKRLNEYQSEELREIVQNSVYSSLYAHESYDRLASSREYVNSIRVLMPPYYKPATLLDGLVTDYEKKGQDVIDE